MTNPCSLKIYKTTQFLMQYKNKLVLPRTGGRGPGWTQETSSPWRGNNKQTS